MSLFFGALLSSNIGRTFADSDDTSVKSENSFVTIHDNGNTTTVKTDAGTVEGVLKRAKIELTEGDVVEPGLTAEINQKDFEITIYRARPVVVVDGVAKKYLMTTKAKMKEIVSEAGIVLYDGDKIVRQNNVKNLLEVGMVEEYEIKRHGGEIVVVTEEIDFTRRTIRDVNTPVGVSKITQEGEKGEKEITYEVKYQDGKEVSRIKKNEVITKQPVEEITTLGVEYTVTTTPDRETCALWARAAGVSEADLDAALWIIEKESHCRYNATNASSGAYGIPQALPGDKMASAGADWRTNPITQIRWMASYVKSRYGGWNGAKRFWEEHHWY
jgi:uncharacterized protein YabE (DUF348 family)